MGINSVISEAIKIAGSQARLAGLAGISQQHVSRLLYQRQSITADTALKIEAATGGRISRSLLRPDYWASEEEKRSSSNREIVP